MLWNIYFLKYFPKKFYIPGSVGFSAMTDLDDQRDELDVLKSIYADDDTFKIIDDKTIQLKYGEDCEFFGFCKKKIDKFPQIDIFQRTNIRLFCKLFGLRIIRQLGWFIYSLINQSIQFSLANTGRVLQLSSNIGGKNVHIEQVE